MYQFKRRLTRSTTSSPIFCQKYYILVPKVESYFLTYVMKFGLKIPCNLGEIVVNLAWKWDNAVTTLNKTIKKHYVTLFSITSTEDTSFYFFILDEICSWKVTLSASFNQIYFPKFSCQEPLKVPVHKFWAIKTDRYTVTYQINMWCDLRKPATCLTDWNCKIKEINSIILMFFFIFDSLWSSVTFDTGITEDPSKKFWKTDNSNFHMILTPQIWYFAPCDEFSQLTSHVFSKVKKKANLYLICNHLEKTMFMLLFYKM